MTVEQARQMLEEYGSASVELDTLMIHMKTHQRRMDQLRRVSQAETDELAAAQAEVKRLCRDALREVRRVAKINREIMSMFQRMPTKKYRDMLMLRYVQGMTMEEIAERMHYDVSSVYRIHPEALAEFAGQKDAMF